MLLQFTMRRSQRTRRPSQQYSPPQLEVTASSRVSRTRQRVEAADFFRAEREELLVEEESEEADHGDLVSDDVLHISVEVSTDDEETLQEVVATEESLALYIST